MPNVTVHKGLFPDQWKFTYSATKQALMRLIIVFSLASSQLHTKRKLIEAIVEEKVEEDLKISENRRACPKSRKRGRFSAPFTKQANKNEHGNGKMEASDRNEGNPPFSGSDHDDMPDSCRNGSDSDWS